MMTAAIGGRPDAPKVSRKWRRAAYRGERARFGDDPVVGKRDTGAARVGVAYR
jgi:hypothetical protein